MDAGGGLVDHGKRQTLVVAGFGGPAHQLAGRGRGVPGQFRCGRRQGPQYTRSSHGGQGKTAVHSQKWHVVHPSAVPGPHLPKLARPRPVHRVRPPQGEGAAGDSGGISIFAQ
jgi:hypothetical protein